MGESETRFVALDLHKAYLMVGAVDQAQTVVLPPRRIMLVQFEGWAKRHLRSTDQVVLEATTNAWYVYDLLQSLVARVVVADPAKAKARMASPVKTDKRDTLALAVLLATNNVPEVWVPPAHVREVRSLVAHRQRLVRQRTAAKNRLRSLLQRHNLVPADGDVFAAPQREWWTTLPLSPTEQLRARHDLATLDYLATLLAEADQELARVSTTEPWVAQMPYVLQLPGIGLTTAMTVLSAIGDIQRFPSAKHLVGYSGLGTKVHASGQTNWSGGITKAGRPELRAALTEAAWAAVRSSMHWRTRFERLAERIGEPKAIIAIARKLLVVIWHVLSAQMADHDADASAVTRKLLRWGTQAGVAQRRRGQRTAFVRQQLDRLGMGPGLSLGAACGPGPGQRPPGPPGPRSTQPVLAGAAVIG
jgi:transposase